MKTEKSIISATKKRITAIEVETLLNDRMGKEIGTVEVEEDGSYEDEKEGMFVTLLCVRSTRSHNDLLQTSSGVPLVYDHRQHTWIHDPVWKKAHALATRITAQVKLAYPAATVLQLHRFKELAPEDHSWRIGIATEIKKKKNKK